MDEGGATLQLLGLVIVGSGLLLGLVSGDLTRELTSLGVGGGIFLLGWLLTKRPWQS